MHVAIERAAEHQRIGRGLRVEVVAGRNEKHLPAAHRLPNGRGGGDGHVAHEQKHQRGKLHALLGIVASGFQLDDAPDGWPFVRLTPADEVLIRES